ncbi:TonB-dependent receptor [Candidatus Moduliflexus flocculans]|uniref:TonB-dependent receptor n=1 Tax=Candidatus Moduliflexus flocculans TaxID=1499966 RepID=A0A0S6VUF8_9BACT|nr:TonB-dependent receptor [Candidatus Moduliflexus flocculans]
MKALDRAWRYSGLIGFCWLILFAGDGRTAELADVDARQENPFAELQELQGRVNEEMLWLQAETYVITASKVLEDVKKSAASITVITDKEIRQMGARDLTDILRTVPGFSYQLERHGGTDFDIRGILKDGDQHILYLLNSQSLSTNYWGSIAPSYLPVPMDNIKQVEVIRGPGSALYGANAFAAIVNIITKTGEQVDGVQMTAGGGSFETTTANLQFGKLFGQLDVAGNANYNKYGSYEGKIAMDGQTLLDQVFGTHASLAPGVTMESSEKIDLMLSLGYGGFHLEGRYCDREHTPSIGISPILNTDSDTPSTDYTIHASYAHDIGEHLTLSGKVYHNYTFMDYYYQVYPDNVVLPTPDGLQLWPDGLIGAPENKNTRTGGEAQGTVALAETNTAVAGLTYEYMNQYDVRAKSNYLATPVKNVVIPRGAVSDVTALQNYNKDVDRTFTAIYAEDLWDIRQNLRLTFGGRYDNYSDFGDSFNPRAGLVWQFLEGYDTKILYGRAFRAPSFYELYNTNNPAFVGNPDLKPEVVDTFELSLSGTFAEFVTARVTGFHNYIRDSIDLATYETQDVFENGGDIRTQGIEAEGKFDFGKGRYVALNYTYQDAVNLETDERLYNVATHKGNVIANLRLSKYLNVYTDLYFQKGFERQEDDPREENPGFTVMDMTLLAKNFFPRLKGLEFRGSVYNLFDKDYAVPTPKDGLPVDFPMPGRSLMFDIRYTF